MQVLNFVLVNGNQVIGEIQTLDLTASFLEVDKPRVVVISGNPENPNEQMVRLLPLVIANGVKDVIQLNLNTVTAISDVSIEMHNHYKQTTSGIDLSTRLKNA